MEARPEAPGPQPSSVAPRRRLGPGERGGRAGRELRASWWIAPTLVPLGFTTWAGFLIAGFRARKTLTILAGFAYLALLVYAMARPERLEGGDGADGTAGMIYILIWVGGITHALIIRRGIKQAILEQSDPSLESARDRLRRRRRARELAQEDPELAYEMGLGRSNVPGWYAAGLVDINHASAEMIAELPGVNLARAREIAKAREELGGFSSVEDMGLALDLPADTVNALRDRTVYLQPDED